MNNLEKRKPKNQIKFNFELTEEQREAKAKVLDNKISILYGVAGTSKSFLACQIALDQFFKREVSNIIICRPTVSNEDIGYLPGSIKEKMEPWVMPIVHNMYMLYNKEKIDGMMKDNNIQILPLQYIQGITFTDSIVILDEAQNATKEQIKMFLTRIGKTSKVILTGDTDQVMLKKKESSGLEELIEITSKMKSIVSIELKENYRDPVIREILSNYK